MAADVHAVADFAETLLDEVVAALDTTAAKAPDYRLVSPGEPVLDCPEMVTTWCIGLALEQTQPTTPPPAAGHRQQAPYAMNIATFGIVISRCQPTPQPARNPIPDPSALTTLARTLNEDLWAVWNWLYWRAKNGDLGGGACSSFYFDPPAPLAQQGETAGWRMQLRARIDGYDATA